jgi:hypothetical protein
MGKVATRSGWAIRHRARLGTLPSGSINFWRVDDAV